MVDKYPLVSVVQHNTSQSLLMAHLESKNRSLGYAAAARQSASARLATSPGSSLQRRPALQPPGNDPARAVSRITSDPWSQLNIAELTFEPTFHQHQIRPNSTTRALFNKTHDLRELYATGYRSIEVRFPCTSIVEHMPIGSEAFWQHLDSVEQLKSTISITLIG
ncbi:BQ5605_C014g07457 [Microbotryum silenes-dioicae]|uniref:BQ5605_C014g07457 protein n=1 Tax=Microbotryum silenes-dioicae TaxID=796604 RepID=A0A2X0MF80_9BASI|nr:BQ5605_C014g07457 [Microbotryum silenes-dioicae]